MKEQCYEIFLLQTLARGDDSQSSRFSLEVMGDAEDALDSLLEKFNTHSFSFMMALNNSYQNINWWPWVIIVFGEEYRIAGHLASIRVNKLDFNFTAFSIPKHYSIEEHGVPPVSVISVKSKDVLIELAKKSPLFNSAWELLKSRSEERRWLVFSDPPEKDWIRKTSKKDDALFQELIVKPITNW